MILHKGNYILNFDFDLSSFFFDFFRCHRLESELKILKKELSKSEVTNKTLQRDLSRLQVYSLFSSSLFCFLKRRNKIIHFYFYYRIQI